MTDPNAAKFIFKQGDRCLELQNFEAAIALFDDAVKLIPDDAEGRHQDAIADYDKAIKFNSNYYKAWSNRANAQFNLGHFRRAIACYDKALSIQPDDPEVWYNRGCTLMAEGRIQDAICASLRQRQGRTQQRFAIASYDKAIDINPKHVPSWMNRGKSLSNQGHQKEALACYEKAIEIQPNESHDWNNRGLVLRRMGRFKEAVASYEQAVKCMHEN